MREPFQLGDHVLHYGGMFVVVGVSFHSVLLQQRARTGRLIPGELKVYKWELAQHQIPWVRERWRRPNPEWIPLAEANQ